MGVGPEVRVGVLLERSVETIVTLLAIFRAGGAYVPLDPDYPDERLRFMVRDAGLELVVAQERLTRRLGDAAVQHIRVDADWPEIAKERDDNPPVRASAANLAYIIYTSGSSGTPKGAMVTRGGMLNCLQWMQQRYELTTQDAFLMHTSLNFDPSVWEVFWPLLVGGRVVIAPAGMLESSALLEYMAEQSVTCAYFVPSQLGMLVQDSRLSECRSLRYVISGGEKLPLPVMRDFQRLSRAELHHSYGPTETAIAATEWTCEAGAERVLIGRPIGNTQAYVVDEQMEPLPLGVAGELYIGGVGVGRGYAGQAALTAERFVPDRFSSEPGARLYRTGDLVRFYAEGKLEFVGRVDQQVKLRGYRIELGEIETVLRRHSQVSAAVVVLNEAEGDKRLVAYVVSEAEAGALREYLKAQLPDYMVPSFFVKLNELPLLPNGKLDRRALPPAESVVVAEAEYAAPRTATEELLAGMWAQVLHVNRVGINDDFFALGGHSLLATQVIARMRDAFGQEVALQSLFDQPTVAGLAQTIETAQLAGAGLSIPALMPISGDAELPLSFAQQRLWFLDQLEPGSAFYNIQAAVRLEGQLDVVALERTMSEIIRRHEVLRTTFVAVDGEPKQVIKPFTPVTLAVFDVSELNPAERDLETRRLLREEATRPFDLARGPLVRACLVRVKADEHVALVTMHHIVSDGWSMSVLIHEVAELYSAYVRGEESPLLELPIQYGDFAHWQRGWLQGEVLAAQLDYWRDVLAEAPAMLELPTDRPRPREQTFNGAAVSVTLAEELTAELKALSQRERVTLFMTLLAAFQSLLFRHSGQEDIVVGTPIANRRYRELEELIGFFVNTLALRARSLATLRFNELLQRVREVTLGAYAHQDLPFEKLVEELQPERDLSRNPLFQVLFAVQNAPRSALELPGLTLERQGGESRTTRFDLECHLWEEEQVLRGVFVYNTDLFDQMTIERLVVNYQTLLQSIVADATVAVASLRLLRAEDERQLLYEWNETSSEEPQGVVHELFAQQVKRTPHQTAVVFDDVSLTFAELDQRSNVVASYLQSKGVGADTVVGVMLERSVEMVVAVLGVLKAGGAYLPLDPEYPRERLQFMLADAAVGVLLTQEQLADSISADVDIIRLDTDWHVLFEQAVDERQHAAVTSDNLAYVVYTSGSTGQPKGVAMTHRVLVNLLHWQMGRSTPAPRTLQFSSLSFDVSFQEIFSTWCAGGTLVLMREAARRDAGALWQLLIRERIERLFLPFVALQYLAEASEHNEEHPSTLREVITAGEQLRITRHIRSLFAKLAGCTLDNHYGPSETHVVTALKLDGDAATWPELPAIGRPIANAQVYVLDERLQPVPVGVAGELYLGGEVLARGYLNRAALSAEKFLPHPFMADGGSRLYRTGDQARYLADSNIEFLGRRDQQVKVRGYRIELGEVEVALRQQPQVREAVVIISPTASGENRLIAYVLTEAETTLTTTALRGGLRELLPGYMIPAAFVLLAEFPLTASGKIDRRALQARPVELEASGESVLPRTPAEEIVAAIWAEVLGRETIGVHDNFFELGGHSLLATQVISRVRDAFGQEVALRSLFERPTVAGLIESIEQQQRAGAGLLAPPLAPVTDAQRLPLSFAQRRLWFLDQMEPGSSSYNISAAVRLRGKLNVEVLEQTLSEVVRRHKVLRTRFIAIDGEPAQVIDAAAMSRLEVLDLSALDEEAREAEMLRLVRVEGNLPFDLSRGPLLRVSLIRLQAEDHVAAVTMPHIVTDAWSMGIFINEVAALYGAYVRGEESPLAELPIQYADFAHWQRGWLQGEVLAGQLDYWRTELADAPTVIDLPIDKPRPPVQTYRGALQPLQLSTELSAQLRDLSGRHGATLFMTLLAAFELLLCRYAGQEQVLVGSPIANRNRSETEGLIGFFVNMLVLRGDMRGNPSFSKLLRRVRETALSAYAHQDLPFEKLVEELQPERDMTRSPLFQVTFTMQNAPGEALELPGLSLSRVQTSEDSVKFELSLVLEERQGAIAGAMAYKRDLFEATTIERLMASYERVLQAVVEDAEQRVLEIDLLSETERQQILYGWNETRTEHRDALTIHRLFTAQAARSGEAVALVFEGEQLSYAELDRRSNQLAHHLVSLGVTPDSLVAVALDRSLELFIALLGILKAGAAYLPLDLSYPLPRLSFMLADAGAPLLLTTEALADELPIQWTPPVLLDTDWDVIALNSDEALPETVVAADQLAYVMYTSGSTGTPKGVAVTHAGVVRLVTSPNYIRLDRDETLLQLAPLTFDASTLEVWGALLNGARLVVMPPGASALDEISRVIVDEGVTTLWLTAGLFHLMVDEQLAGLSHVNQLLAGGDVLSVRHVEKYLAAIDGSEQRLINGYGPTENTTFTCCHVMNGQTRLNWSVPIGRPITNTRVYVLDAEMQGVPVGVVGELYAGGAGLARGYFNQPELTAERFVPHPHSAEPGERLYRTGDTVRWHENGELEFIGRVDGQVKIRGFRIEVGEIEAVLTAHPAVREAVVLVREDERRDKRLAAYVVQKAESAVTAGELKDYLRERLPEYMQVQWVVAVAELPLTTNGKVDRRALQALEVEIAGGENAQARTPVEEILAAIWEEVLGRKTVSVHDNFFELGGHSLLATQVISRVRDVFGQEVALRSLFEQPTVAGLAREIEAGRLEAELQAPPLQRVARAERLPLSFAQQRLWFLDQLAPGSSFYNIPAAVRLNGLLNVAALERTLSEVVRRHEVLRTHFIAIDGEPVQVIEAAAPIKLDVLDLSALDEVERTAETERLVAEESARPFDLSRGPLLRMSLLRLSEDEHVALLTMHHIVSDGWSIGLLVREVAALYSAYVRGEESPLEELPLQYADFAHWQRNWLQGDVLAAQFTYWREALAGAPAFIDLPLDKPRPPIQGFRGADYPLQLSAELSAQLKDLSRQNGATLFMTLLAAFELLLCRYAGQEQVLVGSPIANRNRSETEGLIGFFVNTLVLRGDVRGNPSFRELLRRVRETALGAYAHQDMPFEKLVEELQPERDMSRSPLFQVVFVLQNAPGEALELEGLRLSRVGSAGDTAKFELTLGLEEVGDTIAGALNYNCDLYEAETIGRLAASYERVLQAVVADAEQRVSELRLLSEMEEAEMLLAHNRFAREYRRDVCIHEVIDAQVERRPDAVAVVYEAEQLSYEELNQRANQLAHYLGSLGVGPGARVGILMTRSLEMVVALLAVLKAGAAYVPLDPDYPSQRLLFMLEDAGAPVLLSQQRLHDSVAAAEATVVLVDSDWDRIKHATVANPQTLVTSELPAYVIYTSGSTGVPKGVSVTHRSLLNLVDWHLREFEVSENDRATQLAGLAFDASVWELWPYLAAGATVHLPPDDIRISPAGLQDWLLSRNITISFLPTPMAERMLSLAWPAQVALRRVLTGGDKLSQHPNGCIPFQLVNNYGPTENTVVATSGLVPVERGADWSPAIGRPIDNVRTYLLDDNGYVVPSGVPGELYIGGESLALGYLNRPELTSERFIPDPFSEQAGARMYRTGDRARYRADGELEFLGRTDEQVKIRGFRIELNEIEAVLNAHPSIGEAVLLAREDVPGDKRLVAYVVARPDAPSFTSSELREHLGAQLPQYMIPAAFVFLEALPLTPNGKIDRQALPAPDQARPELGKEFVAPRTGVEEILAGIWEELLDVRPVGVRDDFFSLGGHSLLGVRLMARIESSFGQNLPLASLFQGATVEKLAGLLHEPPHDRGASALVGIQPNGEGTPFFCVHPGGGNVLCYKELANHLGSERPFYGLQARGLAENQIPHTRIEDMAAYYIDAIRTLQPDGPYLIGGWSMGGVVAYEMARQLETRGEQVSLLALLDARPVTSVAEAAPLDELTLLTNFARDLGLPVDGLQLSTSELAELDADELLSYVLQRAIDAGVVPGDIQLAHARRLFEVFKINVQAMQSYRPKASSTRVTLIKAGEQELADEIMGWGALTSGEIEIHRVPGSHFTIVREPYVSSLAERLAACIDRATLPSLVSHT